jgi:hypothetical protein
VGRVVVREYVRVAGIAASCMQGLQGFCECVRLCSSLRVVALYTLPRAWEGDTRGQSGFRASASRPPLLHAVTVTHASLPLLIHRVSHERPPPQCVTAPPSSIHLRESVAPTEAVLRLLSLSSLCPRTCAYQPLGKPCLEAGVTRIRHLFGDSVCVCVCV